MYSSLTYILLFILKNWPTHPPPPDFTCEWATLCIHRVTGVVYKTGEAQVRNPTSKWRFGTFLVKLEGQTLTWWHQQEVISSHGGRYCFSFCTKFYCLKPNLPYSFAPKSITSTPNVMVTSRWCHHIRLAPPEIATLLPVSRKCVRSPLSAR